MLGQSDASRSAKRAKRVAGSGYFVGQRVPVATPDEPSVRVAEQRGHCVCREPGRERVCRERVAGVMQPRIGLGHPRLLGRPLECRVAGNGDSASPSGPANTSAPSAGRPIASRCRRSRARSSGASGTSRRPARDFGAPNPQLSDGLRPDRSSASRRAPDH